MKPFEEERLTALQAASRSGDAGSVAKIWRELTAEEQENVLFSLLDVQSGASEDSAASLGGSPDPSKRRAHEPAVAVVGSDASMDPAKPRADETEALVAVEQTELIPKHVEDLRSLSSSGHDDDVLLERPPAPSAYWCRWRRRWKISALVAAWAVTTVFAFTVNTSTFGPMEWLVALFGTVVLGGAFVGTLVNFAVASIAARTGEQLTASPAESDSEVASQHG